MSGSALLLMMLLVSWTSLGLQGAALLHLIKQRSSYRAEELAGRGYIRTAACRVAAACIYVTVALVQAAGRDGTLTPEALIVLTTVQGIWLVNAGLDIRVRRRLRAARGQLLDTLPLPEDPSVSKRSKSHGKIRS